MAPGSAARPGGSAAAWRVVSDVDHTLLEHPGESAFAGECLRRLHQRGIPTLLASSKTFAEMVAFQTLAELPPQPFLFENGCGIGWPTASWPAAAGAPQQVLGAYGAIVRGGDPERLRTLLHHLRASGGLRFSLLEELNFEAIRQLIGLEEPLARLALQRLASVPLVWQDDEAALDRLRRQLAGEGLGAVSGGRLVHVAPPCDKAEALALVLSWEGEAPHTTNLLACGDSENDRALLESAAWALVFHPADRPALTLAPPAAERPRIERTAIAGGPEAWLAAVEAALAEAAPALTEAVRATPAATPAAADAAIAAIAPRPAAAASPTRSPVVPASRSPEIAAPPPP
jgi:mannosyl-3-phosphoglycerate phosphatase family protein